MFLSYLMDKVDVQRETITAEEFKEIDFTGFGIPKIFMEMITKLTAQSFEHTIQNKVK